MKDIVMYTTNWCPACVVAKKVMTDKGLSFREINIETSGMSREQLQEITGRWEVPAIVIDGKNIGGLDNLIKIV